MKGRNQHNKVINKLKLLNTKVKVNLSTIKLFNLSTIFVILFPALIHAQQTISLKSAIDSALKNNFDIQIARNYSEISKISNTYGMAGGLPSVNISAGDNGSVTNVYQKLSTGNEITTNNVNGNNLNAGINASMTLFNGFKIVATKEKLNYLQTQGELQLNQEIQNVIADIMLKYYDIVKQESYLNIIYSSLDMAKKKLEIVNTRVSVGMANDANYLQAQIDVNSIEQNIKSQQIVINQAKADLLQLMNVKTQYQYNINDSIVADNTLKLETITTYLEQNPQYLFAEQQIKINEQIVKEVTAQRYPSLKINGGYNFTNNKTSAGTYLTNKSIGPNYGISLQIPLYNSSIYKTQQNIAEMNVNTSILQKESILYSLKTSTIKIYDLYNSTLEQISSQQKNYEMSKKLVDVILKRFQLNMSTILEVKSAQSSYEEAGFYLINLQFAAKNAEIQLKKMAYLLQNN